MTLFSPHFTITPGMQQDLEHIEAVCQEVAHIKLHRDAQKLLQEKTKSELIHNLRHLEVLNKDSYKIELESYLNALQLVTEWSKTKKSVTQSRIKELHSRLITTEYPYRDGQNAVFNTTMTKVLYLPPKAEEVPQLMHDFIRYLGRNKALASPLLAGIAHFSINAIHPYYDGNGRCARLVTRWILGHSGCDLQGLYCLERDYAKDLMRYYNALSLHGAKTFHASRSRADITLWLEYFLQTMRTSFTRSLRRIRIISR